MPIIETAVAKCDVCGMEEQFKGGGIFRTRPEAWTELETQSASLSVERKVICPAHSIQVTHNGDVVTLVKGTE